MCKLFNYKDVIILMWSSSPDSSCQVRSAAQNAQTNVTDIILVELLFHEDQECSYTLLTFGNTLLYITYKWVLVA